MDAKNLLSSNQALDSGSEDAAPNVLKTHKVVTVEAFVPEAKGNAFFAAKGEGHDWPLATYRALKNLAKVKGVKGKRITTIKATISIGTVIDE